MRHLSEQVPKPLIEIAGKAMIVHQIEHLCAAGITDLVINLAYRGDQIRAHLGDGRRFGVHIEYSEEPADALETGGGIAAALDLLGGEPFAVVNCDAWTDFDFASLEAPQREAHLVLVPNPPHHADGDFRLLDGNVVRAGGEMATFSGIATYRPTLFRGPHPPRFALAPLLHEAVRRGNVSAELYRGLWLDVGTPERLILAKSFAAAQYSRQNPV